MANKKKTKSASQPKAKRPVNPNRRLYQAIAGAVAIGGVLFLLFMRYGGPDPEPELPPTKLPPYTFPEEPASLNASELTGEVAKHMEDLIAEHSGEAAPLAVAAEFFTKVTKLDQAETLWRKCLNIDPNNVDANIGLAIVMLQRDENAKAVALLKNAVAVNNKSCEAFAQLAKAQAKLGMLTESRESATTGLKNCPDHLDLAIALGQAELELEQFESAKIAFEKAFKKNEQTESALLGLATAHTRLKEPTAAKKYRDLFQKLRDNRKREASFEEKSLFAYRDIAADALTAAGAIYEKHGAARNAELAYRRAVELSPDSRSSLAVLSDFFRRKGKMNYAVLPQRKLVQLDPKNSQNQLNLGNYELAIGEFDRAETAYQQAAATSNNWPPPQRGLAVLHVQKGEPKAARKFAEQAVQWNPTPKHYQLLAMVCNEIGDAQGAFAAEQNAIKAANPNPPIGGVQN